MLERIILKALQKRLDALDILHRRLEWIGRHSAPDLVAMGAFEVAAFPSYYRGGGNATVWVETKCSGEAAREAQAREHKRMRDHGQTVLVINSLELIDRWFPL